MQNPTYDEEFYVEKILAKREYPNPRYLIKWEGWDIKDSTWEPIENLENALDLVDEFEKNEVIKKYDKLEKKNTQIVKSKETITNKFIDDSNFETPLRERTYTSNKDKEEQKVYKEYKSNRMKKEKEKEREKKDNVLIRIPNDEEPECIKTVKLIRDCIHCQVAWKTKSNGIKADEAFIPSVILADKFPIMLIEFYESKIKFI